jgi:hypothetical protein
VPARVVRLPRAALTSALSGLLYALEAEAPG